MPRTAITPQKATAAGTTITYEPANTLGNSFTPARGRALHVRNGSGATVTVTVPTPAVADGLAIADRAIPVAAGTDNVFAPGDASVAGVYAQPDGTINIDYSAVTTVTVAVVDQP